MMLLLPCVLLDTPAWLLPCQPFYRCPVATLALPQSPPLMLRSVTVPFRATWLLAEVGGGTGWRDF